MVLVVLTHKWLIQQDSVESLQNNTESLEEELPLLSIIITIIIIIAVLLTFLEQKRKWNSHHAWFWRLRGFSRASVHTLPAVVWRTPEYWCLVLHFTITSLYVYYYYYYYLLRIKLIWISRSTYNTYTENEKKTHKTLYRKRTVIASDQWSDSKQTENW